jgi:hypothetical protein
MFTARSTAQKEAWRQLLDGMKVGGDDKFIKPEIGVDAATKEVNYKFVPILRQKRSRTKAAASGGATADSAAIIQEAKRAIAQGADPTAVADKLWSKYNLRMPSETAAMPPGATPADMNALLNALRGGMATGGDVYPPMSNQAAMAPASVRAETMPIPGAPTAFQPNSPSLVDIIRQLQSYADR